MSVIKDCTNTGLKKWFAFDRLGITIVVVAALALAAFGFFDPEMMMAGGTEGGEELVVETAQPEESEAQAARAAQKTDGGFVRTNPRLATAEDDGDADQSAPVTKGGGQRRGGAGQGGQNPNPGLRSMSLSTIYLGESDWDFIGVITLRFILNIIFAYILICLVFSRDHRIKEYSFSYFVSNILIFMVTSLLASVRVRQGFAFGLFAILSILRFRTEQLQVREMTFLFAALILGVINSLATDGLSIFAILWANIILCVFVYVCDQAFIGVTDMITLVYDNTSLLARDKRKELFEDIKKRFGYDVVKVSIIEMSYLTDSAKVKLVYKLSS